jgi:hypothetical protein
MPIEGYTFTSTWPPVRSLISLPKSSAPLTLGEPGSLLMPIFILIGSAARAPVEMKNKEKKAKMRLIQPKRNTVFLMAYLLLLKSIQGKNDSPPTRFDLRYRVAVPQKLQDSAGPAAASPGSWLRGSPLFSRPSLLLSPGPRFRCVESLPR